METSETHREPAVVERRTAARAESQLRAQVETLELRLRKRDEQRRAMLHIMGDLNESNTYQPSPRQVSRSSPSGRGTKKTRDRQG
jgi:hypothetical protein